VLKADIYITFGILHPKKRGLIYKEILNPNGGIYIQRRKGAHKLKRLKG